MVTRSLGVARWFGSLAAVVAGCGWGRAAAAAPADDDAPVLMPLSVDPVVAGRPARLAAVGTAGSDGAIAAGGSAELALASRVALGATVGVGAVAGEPESDVLIGFATRVELLDESTAPLGLGASARYLASGFSVDRSELELSVQAARSLGSTRILGGLTGGRELTRPEGDVEANAAVVHAIAGPVGLGVDARGRAGLRGGAEAERERERELAELGGGEGEGEAGEHAWDARAGAVATVTSGPVGAYAFAGVGVVGLRDAGASASAVVSLGVQLVR